MLKIIFTIIILVTGGYYALSNTPFLAVKEAVSLPNAVIITSVYLVLLYGIFRNKAWGYIATALLSCFWIFALIFNGFYKPIDYILLFLSLASVVLIYPAVKKISTS